MMIGGHANHGPAPGAGGFRARASCGRQMRYRPHRERIVAGAHIRPDRRNWCHTVRVIRFLMRTRLLFRGACVRVEAVCGECGKRHIAVNALLSGGGARVRLSRL